jgi:apolipoprotein N-acyltransferase
MNRPPLPVLRWPRAFIPAAVAIACFHLAYSFPNFNPLRFLILAVPVCLVQLARLRTTRQCFYIGLAVGFACIAPQLECFWRIFGPAAIPLWIVLALWTAAFVALTHGTLVRFGPLWTAVFTPFLWTGLEYFRSELYYLKFSWLNIGYAFAESGMVPFHLAGMYGIGFVAAAIAGLFLVLEWFFPLAILTAAIGIGAFVSGVAPPRSGVTVRIAGVQLEFPPEYQLPQILDRLAHKHPAADLFVLSEYSLDGPPSDALKSWCRRQHRYLIVGGKDPVGGKDQFYNTAFVIGPGGDIVFRQVKSVPIQFFKDGLPAPQQSVWESPWGKIGICICYDLSYTRVTDHLVEAGAQLIVVPTMDVSDWGRHQHQLHALVAPVRAAEYGLPIFRLASSGISQAVDPNGRVLARGPFDAEEADLFAEFQLPTRGARPVDRFLAPCAVGVTAFLLVAVLAPRRRPKVPVAPPPEMPTLKEF